MHANYITRAPTSKLHSLTFVCITILISYLSAHYYLVLPPSRAALHTDAYAPQTPNVYHGSTCRRGSEDRGDGCAKWEPLLHYVLVAAVGGSVICILYFKNPGRELEDVLPMDVLKRAKLYLRGC
jgi:hypothetical protein